jgi:hypothetical protein
MPEKTPVGGSIPGGLLGHRRSQPLSHNLVRRFHEFYLWICLKEGLKLKMYTWNGPRFKFAWKLLKLPYDIFKVMLEGEESIWLLDQRWNQNAERDWGCQPLTRANFYPRLLRLCPVIVFISVNGDAERNKYKDNTVYKTHPYFLGLFLDADWSPTTIRVWHRPGKGIGSFIILFEFFIKLNRK